MGDSKDSHRKTWYLCNAPHRFRIKWHTHKADTCHTHIHILEDQGDSNPTTNLDDAPTDSNSSEADTYISSISDATDSPYVTSLLAYSFNLMGDRLEVKDAAVVSLMALNQACQLYHRLILVLLDYYAYGFPSYPPPPLPSSAYIFIVLPSWSAYSYRFTN